MSNLDVTQLDRLEIEYEYIKRPVGLKPSEVVKQDKLIWRAHIRQAYVF